MKSLKLLLTSLGLQPVMRVYYSSRNATEELIEHIRLAQRDAANIATSGDRSERHRWIEMSTRHIAQGVDHAYVCRCRRPRSCDRGCHNVEANSHDNEKRTNQLAQHFRANPWLE